MQRLLGVQFPRRRSSDRLRALLRLAPWACRALRRRGNRTGRRKHHLFAERRGTSLGSSLHRRGPVLGGLLGLERANAVRKDQELRRQDKLRELFQGSRFTSVRVLASAVRCRGCRLAVGREARVDPELLGRQGAHARAECLPDARVRAHAAAIRKRNANRRF